MMARRKAGKSSGFRLVIKLPSQTTSSSTQEAPAFVTSASIEKKLVAAGLVALAPNKASTPRGK